MINLKKLTKICDSIRQYNKMKDFKPMEGYSFFVYKDYEEFKKQYPGISQKEFFQVKDKLKPGFSYLDDGSSMGYIYTKITRVANDTVYSLYADPSMNDAYDANPLDINEIIYYIIESKRAGNFKEISSSTFDKIYNLCMKKGFVGGFSTEYIKQLKQINAL